MTPTEKCQYEDRWTQVLRDMGDLRADRRKDPTATWVRWAVPLVTTALLGVYGVLESRIDSTQENLQKWSAESLADRRTLAERQVSLETRQAEQFDRILAEIKMLRSQVERQNR